MQVWTVVSGKAAVIASGKPLSPSITRQAICETNLPRGHDSDEDVLDATVFQLVHHRQPELGPFVLSDPKPQNLADAVADYAQGHVNGLVIDHAAIGVPDLHTQSIENDDGIHPVQSS